MARAVPLPYMVVFTIFDLIAPLAGMYLHLFMPDMVLGGFTPSAAKRIAPETQVLLDGMAGWFAGLVILHLYARLARPGDVSLWRALQGALTLVDVFMLIGFGREMMAAKRTDTSAWRGEDWQNVGGYVFLTVVRGLFTMGVGLQKVPHDVKAKKK